MPVKNRGEYRLGLPLDAMLSDNARSQLLQQGLHYLRGLSN